MSDDAPKHKGEWELVDETGSGVRQFRQRVPGGWLVLVSLDGQTGVTFLPDPDHEWDPPIKRSRKRGFY